MLGLVEVEVQHPQVIQYPLGWLEPLEVQVEQVERLTQGMDQQVREVLLVQQFIAWLIAP